MSIRQSINVPSCFAQTVIRLLCNYFVFFGATYMDRALLLVLTDGVTIGSSGSTFLTEYG